MEITADFWRDRSVFVTGHTGFKGGWLTMWLQGMGARVHGYSLPPPAGDSFFQHCKLSEHLAGSTMADIRDSARLTEAMRMAKPAVVFHLAAQPLVRASYAEPVETYAVNVMGTVHLLEAVRQTPSVKAVVVVTTDKCYENREQPEAYRETDPMGGHDPYSSSKGCAELVTAAYRRSFLAASGVRVASARAGNVIGGGDWAVDRLIPDFLRALDRRQTLVIRSPLACRPWQHVLEPISGYLLLAQSLLGPGSSFDEAWNFGPLAEENRSVRWIVECLCDRIPGATWRAETAPQPHEAHLLALDSTKAHRQLGWRPRWNLAVALQRTLDWHLAWRGGQDMEMTSRRQIREYWNEPTGS